MRASILLGNVVRVAEHVLLVPVVPLQGALDRDQVNRAGKVDDGAMDRLLVPVQVDDECLDAPVELEDVFLPVPLVQQVDAYALVQEREFPEPFGQDVVVKLDIGENLRAWAEPNNGSPALGLANHDQIGLRLAQTVTLLVGLALPMDGQVQGLGQRVDDGHADAVEAAGDFVGVAVELTACVEDSHDHLGGGLPLLRVDIYGDTAAIVGDCDGFVRVDGDGDIGAEPGQSLIDGVIDHLKNHVVEAGAVIGIANVHAGAFADSVEAP